MQILSPAQQTSLLILLALALIVLGVVFARRFLRRALGLLALRRADAAGREDDEPTLPGPWRALRHDVEMSNRVLTALTFEKMRQIFLDFYASDAPGALSPGSLTREWQQEEFLLVVDQHGAAPAPLKAVIERFSRTAAEHPAFRRWFREAVFDEGKWAGVPVLLVARWLCHLAGLRHATVEIFIDPPELPGHTLVQVRGMEKFEAAGAFDIPCAGHVSGVDSVETALAKELWEELNLKITQLDDLRVLGRYNSYPPDDGRAGVTINNEHRVLYRARLKPEAAASIRFSDGEVAGLSVFAVSELRALLQRYPERVASGLGDAIGFYE